MTKLKTNEPRRATWTALAAMGALAMACTGPATADLSVRLEAEDSIPDGLQPGTGREDIVDGWSVSFERYVLVVGDVRVARPGEELEVRSAERRAVDLTAIGPSGVVLAEFEAIDAVRWDHFEYGLSGAAGATRHESVSLVDFDEMVSNDWSYLLEGTLTKEDGESCVPGAACRAVSSLRFRLGVRVVATFGPCEAEEGLPGVTVTPGGAHVAATIHGDHLFFDAFPSGAELIERRAQWIANADVDGDDLVTADELSTLAAADLLPSDLYSVSGSPFPVETGLDYLRGQLATQGHFQGEGECPWTVARP